MMTVFQNTVDINVVSLKPGVTIWYARIPQIIHSLFKKDNGPDFRRLLNQSFKKEDFVYRFFSPDEINTINRFKALKKQIEWMSGRYLIKRMIQQQFLPDSTVDQITLSYREKGAPFVTNLPCLPVSLSHSNDYTASACCMDTGQNLGIDIEKIARKPDAFFMKTAFTQNEIRHLNDGAAQIFKNWTIKEAYLKYIQKGFHESLHRVEVINNEIFHNHDKINVNVFSTVIEEGYVLSLVSD